MTPGDVVERIGLAHVARRAPDHDRDLAFVVGLGDVDGDHDRLLVADQRAGRLGEGHGRGDGRRHVGLEAKAVAGATRDRGEPVVMISGEGMGPWRKATEPVIAAWHKQMKEKKLDGDKLLADVHALLAKYAEEPEPEPPQAPRLVEQPRSSKP